jgi:hypothetical protein
LLQQFWQGVSPEWLPTDKQLIKHDTQAKDVGATVDSMALTTSLFWAQVANIAAGLDSGFISALLIDPAVIGDISGNDRVNALDAGLVAMFVAGLPVPQIPPIPGGVVIAGGGGGGALGGGQSPVTNGLPPATLSPVIAVDGTVVRGDAVGSADPSAAPAPENHSIVRPSGVDVLMEDFADAADRELVTDAELEDAINELLSDG